MIITGVTNTYPSIGEYPTTGPAATTANVRDVLDAASIRNIDIAKLSQNNSAARQRAGVAAITGVGKNIDVYI